MESHVNERSNTDKKLESQEKKSDGDRVTTNVSGFCERASETGNSLNSQGRSHIQGLRLARCAHAQFHI